AGIRPTPAVLVWRPRHGEPTRVVAAPCDAVQGLSLVNSRLAFDCDHTFLDVIAQSLWVVDLRTRLPHQAFFGHGWSGARGTYLVSLVGAGGLLAFSSEREDPHGVVRRRTLWRIDGFHRSALRSGSDAGVVVAAGGGRLAVALENGRVALTRADGSLLRVFRPARPRPLLRTFGGEPRP